MKSHALVEVRSTNIVCDDWEKLWGNMPGREPLSPCVEVFVTKEEALWAECERNNDPDRGRSSEGILPLIVPSARAMSNFEARPSSHDLNKDKVETEDLDLAESQGDVQIVEVGEVSSLSHQGEGILLSNPRLKEMRAPQAHES